MISHLPHSHHHDIIIRAPSFTIILAILVLCILSIVSSSSIKFGTDNTFMEGSRTTFSFTLDKPLHYDDSEIFMIAPLNMDTTNAPVALYIEGVGTMGYLATWPIFTNTTLWGHYPDQREVTCWANNEKDIPVGHLEYPIGFSIEEAVMDMQQLAPLEITFKSTYNGNISSDSVITCYIQSIVGTFMTQLDIYRESTSEHITVDVLQDTHTKITFQTAKKGQQYPIVDLPFTISNAMPYSAYVYQFGSFLDFHRPAPATTTDGNTDSIPTTSLPSKTATDEQILLSEKLSETDVPTKLFMGQALHSVGPWSKYGSWSCTDNLARIYVLSSLTEPGTPIPEDSPYGNMRYVVLTSGSIKSQDTIQCTFPAHVEDLVRMEPIIAHPERFDEMLSYYMTPQHENPEKYKIIHQYTPYMRIGRTDTHTTSMVSQYYNTQLLSDYIVTKGNILVCDQDDSRYPDDQEDPTRTTHIECRLDSVHRLSKLVLVDPSSYHDNTQPVYNLSKHSTPFVTSEDYNTSIHNLSSGVTFKDGVFYFDNSDWEPSPDRDHAQRFSFDYTPYNTNLHNKFVMPLARLYITLYTINEDGSSDLTKETMLDGVPFFTRLPYFKKAAEYYITPSGITLTTSLQITSHYVQTQQKEIPISISPYTQTTMASLDRAIINNNAQKAIQCLAYVGNTSQPITMTYSRVHDLPIWSTMLPSNSFSSPEQSKVKIICTIKTDLIINFKPHYDLFLTLFDTVIKDLGPAITYDPKVMNTAVYKPIAIVRNIIVPHPISPFNALQSYQYIVSNLSGISRECRSILGNITTEQIAITDIEYIDNPSIVSYIPGSHAGSIFGTQGRVTMLVKEGLTLFDNLPAGCPPHAFEDMTIYGSKPTNVYERGSWYDKKLIQTPDIYYPQSATGQKCTHGYQCIDNTATCYNGVCTTMLYPDTILSREEYEPSFVSFLL